MPPRSGASEPVNPVGPPTPGAGAVAPGGMVAGLSARLAAAGCVAPREEADELVATVGQGAGALEDAVRRREAGEPLAWVTGRTRFCGHDVGVDPGVYVPRAQTEALAERAAALLVGWGAGGRAVDLCTGAGAVAMHCQAAVSGAQVVGVDADRRAVACARRNGVATVLGDLGGALRGRWAHVVTAVAPYVPTPAMPYLPADVARYEPRGALEGGEDGLDVVRRVAADAARLLRPGGWLLVELGGEQDRLLGPALARWGFGELATWDDEDGDLRGLSARLVQPA